MDQAVLLIVEDETELREILTDLLADNHLKILTAENGMAGLSIVKSTRVDAILSDINMPVMSGLQLLAELRNLNIATPFVVLSGYADKANTVQALRNGAMDFLEKPFEIGAVKKVVEKAVEIGLSLRTLEHELEELCKRANLSEEEAKAFKEAQRAILLMKKQNAIPRKNVA